MARFLHRYKSTIHGNYRRNYLRCGLFTAIILITYILLRLLFRNPAPSPQSYLSDAILLLSIALCALLYRRSLPHNKVSLKELTLFGFGTALIASILYGIFLCAFQTLIPSQTVLYTQTLSGTHITLHDPQIHYWAAWWAILTTVKMIILGGFGAFLAALLFRTEKGSVVSKSDN